MIVAASALPALLAAILVAGCAGGGQAAAAPPPVPADAPRVAVPAEAFSVHVTRVVDGDTVVAQVGGSGPRVRVRLLGVDTPETVKPGTPVACYGHEASAFTTALLTGRTLLAAYQDERVDDFGRQLWDLWLPDGRSVQALLVASGAARAYPYEPNTAHATVLADGQALAQRDRRGLWRACALTEAFPQLRSRARP